MVELWNSWLLGSKSRMITPQSKRIRGVFSISTRASHFTNLHSIPSGANTFSQFFQTFLGILLCAFSINRKALLFFVQTYRNRLGELRSS